ncbi:MAG: dihydrofolate reductase family protein [Actinomycetota bacterium]|nr:dihydrofolate reductase family protein [Actinomycetota bacterium]
MPGAHDLIVYGQLWPQACDVSAVELLNALRQGATSSPHRPFVFLNMISTLDGRAAVDGGTRGLGGRADIEMLLELRTVADAVLIGAGTVGAEGYGRLLRRPERRERRQHQGLAPDPVAVLVSHALDLPWGAALFAAAEQPILIYTEASEPVPQVAARLELVRMSRLSLPEVMRDLLSRGVHMLLCEGGPRLNRSLLEAGLIDELFLTLSPLITADAREPAIVAGPALPAPPRGSLAWILKHGDELFLRYGIGRPRAGC